MSDNKQLNDNLIWMSGPADAVELDQYTNGPCRWFCFTPDQGDVIVGKLRDGKTVVKETYEGVSLL